MAPPLRDEIIVDRATQNSARNRFDILNKESDELDAQSRQLGEAYETMIRIQTRYCIQFLILKFQDFLRKKNREIENIFPIFFGQGIFFFQNFL